MPRLQIRKHYPLDLGPVALAGSPGGRWLAYEKVGAESNRREQSDAEHRFLMSAHACLSFAGSKGTHN